MLYTVYTEYSSTSPLYDEKKAPPSSFLPWFLIMLKFLLGLCNRPGGDIRLFLVISEFIQKRGSESWKNAVIVFSLETNGRPQKSVGLYDTLCVISPSFLPSLYNHRKSKCIKSQNFTISWENCTKLTTERYKLKYHQ
jgi:hypothetical protein